MRDRVEALIGRLAPDPVCDDCIARRLDVEPEDVRPRVHELAGVRGYERATGRCTLCDEGKIGTRRVAR